MSRWILARISTNMLAVRGTSTILYQTTKWNGPRMRLKRIKRITVSEARNYFFHLFFLYFYTLKKLKFTNFIRYFIYKLYVYIKLYAYIKFLNCPNEEILSEGDKSTDILPVKMAKKFYRSCMDVGRKNRCCYGRINFSTCIIIRENLHIRVHAIKSICTDSCY